jgi:thiol-disulfide isomerase/thioredoxin
MRHIWIALLFACAVNLPLAQERNEGPANEKAQKTYREALEHVNKHMTLAAFDEFKKADKQDGGRCLPCQRNIIKYALAFHDWKSAEFAADEMISEAHKPQELALSHYQCGIVLFQEGIDKRKDEIFSRAHEEFSKAVATVANFPAALYSDGQALAHLRQDEAAKAQFQQYIKIAKPDDLSRRRAQRFIADPELARARMAPPFVVSTIDGKQLSLDDLQGKVVLLDFWATWCGPCRQALPHIRNMAKKFQDQPLVILSVSLDDDEQKWKDFVTKNEMTWPQYLDGGFDGPIAKVFAIRSIPHTFTIDSDGVLQDEHIGDASMEGKIKKLLARARELQVAEKEAP